jgi:tRNA nucleotidyltransferase (CCA-adding enzyme)
MQTFLVGGAVRDMLLGRTPREYDYVFSGSLEEFLLRHKTARRAGTQFSIAIYNGLEFAPMRGKTIHEDLASRDFTVNAMALDADGRLFAHPEALRDLALHRLSPASSHALADDPVRLFRAARFTATLPGFHISADLKRAMRAEAGSGKIMDAAPERIGSEIHKVLHSARPGNFLRTLNEADCLTAWLQEFAPAEEDAAALHRTADIMDRAAGVPMAVWMALCHDLNTGATQTPSPAAAPTPVRKQPQHHAAAPAARRFAIRIKAPNSFVRAAEVAASCHKEGMHYPALKAESRVSLLMRLHLAALLDDFFTFILAVTGSDFRRPAAEELDILLRVKLPPDQQGRGPESGRLLHRMRCEALQSR